MYSYNYINILKLLVAFIFILSCSDKKTEIEKEDSLNNNLITISDEQYKQLGVVVDSIRFKTFSESIRLAGKVDVPPQNMVSISIPLGGYLVETHLLPGTHVRKGEVIAMVEDKSYIDLQENYLLTKEKLLLAKAEFERQKTLNDAKAASDKTLQQALMEFNNLKTSLNALKEKLKLINVAADQLSPENISKTIKIVAPINGFVTAVNYNIGKYVSPTEVLFELVNPEDIHLALQVFEKDVDKIEIGQKVVAYTNSNPNKKYNGEVILVGRDFSADRTITVHCHFDNYDKNLLPNVYMNAEIFFNQSQIASIPVESVLFFENKNYVLTQVGKNKFKLEEVLIGKESKGFVPIYNAQKFLKSLIVVKGAYGLFMALKNKEE